MLQFFKNLFSGKKEFKHSGPKKSANNRVHPRISVDQKVEVQVEFKLPGADFVPVKTANLSEGGLGVFKSVIPTELLDQEQLFNVRITLGDDQVLTQAKCVHTGAGMIGYQFQGESTALRKLVMKNFQLELDGLDMKGPLKVSDEFMKQIPGKVHWYRSAQGYELTHIIDGDTVNYFSMSFLGQYFEKAPDKPLKFGVLSQKVAALETTSDYALSELVSWKSEVSEETQALVFRFVNNIHSMQPEERQLLLAAIETAFNQMQSRAG